jgi:hypothetical protein
VQHKAENPVENGLRSKGIKGREKTLIEILIFYSFAPENQLKSRQRREPGFTLQYLGTSRIGFLLTADSGLRYSEIRPHTKLFPRISLQELLEKLFVDG